MYFLYLCHYLPLKLVNDLLGITCIVFYLGTFMGNKTKVREWTVIPFNANQCSLEHAFQLAVSRSHANQKRVEISTELRRPCSTNRHTTALPQTITTEKKRLVQDFFFLFYKTD